MVTQQDSKPTTPLKKLLRNENLMLLIKDTKVKHIHQSPDTPPTHSQNPCVSILMLMAQYLAAVKVESTIQPVSQMNSGEDVVIRKSMGFKRDKTRQEYRGISLRSRWQRPATSRHQSHMYFNHQKEMI